MSYDIPADRCAGRRKGPVGEWRTPCFRRASAGGCGPRPNPCSHGTVAAPLLGPIPAAVNLRPNLAAFQHLELDAAVAPGWPVFGTFPDAAMWIGAAIVASAGPLALRGVAGG